MYTYYYQAPRGRRDCNEKRKKSGALEISPRRALFFGAATLFLFAMIFALSISSSLFGVPDIASPLGDFFAEAYGVLSFIIPAYLVFAALILLDKAFRPRLIFILNSIVFPFLTLSAGFSFLRDYNQHASRMLFFAALGRNGFSLLMVALTMIECFIIYALAQIFFPESARRTKPQKEYVRPREERAEDAGVMEATRVPANEITIVRAGRGTPPPIRPLEPTIADLEKEYTAAFEKLRSPEDMPREEEPREEPRFEASAAARQEAPEEAAEAFIAVREENEAAPVLSGLEANLDALNYKLENLGAHLGGIDAQFSTLDTKIETIKDELINGIDEIESPAADGADELEELLELEEDERDAFAEDAAERDALSSGIERIIDEAEAAARQKTESALLEQRERFSIKKKIPRSYDNYAVPVEGILAEAEAGEYWIIDDAAKDAARVLTETLREFNIEAEVTGIRKGPVITSFEILPSPGVKLSKIVNLQDNIALRLAAASVRIVAPIPGKHAVGIEIPNKNRNIVSFREIIESELEKTPGKSGAIPIVLGKDTTGESVTVDLAAMPHLLIAGSTGSGKSVCVNAMILSILYRCPPSRCRLLLIDPKIVELKLYNDIPHLLTPVITEPKRAFQALQYCVYEMERRYACLDSVGARDIKTYNKRIVERNIAAEEMPYIVVVIDEYADLMATTGKELESTVARLAAMSRAVGIHLVLATQRPSIDVITGLIKSNIPSRIAFMVAGMMDSRIIIDSGGAEKLLGKGDMLYSGAVDPFPIRMQGAFVSEEEVERVVDYVKGLGEPDYIDEEIFFDDEEDGAISEYAEGCDPLYDKAMDIVVQQGKASASYIQRRLKIGYNRAARLVEEMESRGIVGPAQGSRPRVLLRAAAG
jgi:S-DNA-T family DNA segregation ATPase FtsK/SpoIIIE